MYYYITIPRPHTYKYTSEPRKHACIYLQSFSRCSATCRISAKEKDYVMKGTTVLTLGMHTRTLRGMEIYHKA